MFFSDKILYLFFALFVVVVVDVYGMDSVDSRGEIIDQSSIIYLKENYPIVRYSEIKVDWRNNNKKIIIQYLDKQISKKIKKIKIFHDGFAIITKKQKPAAAIWCFDLAIICQYRRQDFTEKMQNQLGNYDPLAEQCVENITP